MKKLVLTSVCAVAVTGAAFAQGVVQWNAISPALVTFETNTTVSSFLSSGGSTALQNGTTGKTVAAANSFYYELLYNTAATAQAAPTTLATLDNWLDTGLGAVNSATSVGNTTLSGAVNSTVPFTATDSIIIVGWSANLGTTWAAASTVLNSPSALASVVGTAFFGETSTGYITPDAAGTSPGLLLFGTGTGQIKSLLTPLEPVVVPEPTTLALGAMGVASLLALRRKKA